VIDSTLAERRLSALFVRTDRRKVEKGTLPARSLPALTANGRQVRGRHLEPDSRDETRLSTPRS